MCLFVTKNGILNWPRMVTVRKETYDSCYHFIQRYIKLQYILHIRRFHILPVHDNYLTQQPTLFWFQTHIVIWGTCILKTYSSSEIPNSYYIWNFYDMADYSKFSKHVNLYIGSNINIDFVGFNIIFTITMERQPFLTLDMISRHPATRRTFYHVHQLFWDFF